VTVPEGVTLPAFLSVEGVAEPPPGELVLVLRKKPRIWDLFRGVAPPVQIAVAASRGSETPKPRNKSLK
jgi:hypothetical protein